MISHTYAGDKDRDRINDALLKKSEKALLDEHLAATPSDRENARAKLDEMVNVELIFTDLISQKQIDDFINAGGEISYVFKAVSYGWNGRLPLRKVRDIASLMGDNLILLEESMPAKLHMRTATQTGRVRPVWANGFAGSSGYDGDSSISIAIIDTGVDDSHSDLSGRNVYWNDFTSDGEGTPRDIIQHGTHVAGIALGTGASLGTGTTLNYTDSGSLSGVPSGSFYPSVLDFPSVATTWDSVATWLGGGNTTLYHAYTTKGASSWYAINYKNDTSGVSLSTSFTPSSNNAYSTALVSNSRITTYAVSNSMTNFSPVGDGFNTLSGVAPGNNWVGAKVFTNSGSGFMSWTGAAIDDMVANRVTYNIKVMNLSLGASGDPGIDTSTRQKINSAAQNGILAVISAGNNGPGNTSASEVDDPGRAAMALTIGAANDINELTSYSSNGFSSPGSSPGIEEDYKPDLLAPGGSTYYSLIMSVDSNDADGENTSFSDVQSNDYYNIMGTSMASPFAAGSAALVIDALQSTGELTGASWDFSSSNDVRLVKMLLCATSTETNTNRETGSGYDPTLQRASTGPDGFPEGKDKYEGYGMLNVDAAIEGGTVPYPIGTLEYETLGGSDTARRAWARKVSVTAGLSLDMSLAVPATGDFDMYIYSFTPSPYGTPAILASSTNAGSGLDESINYTPSSDSDLLLVIKRVSGEGQFGITSSSHIYTLDITKEGSGGGTITSSPAGIDCGADCSESYVPDTEVTLSPSPDAGSIFAGWSGDADCSDGQVTMSSDVTCTAIFDLFTYTLDVTKEGNGSGTVTSSPAGIVCGADCSESYVPDTGVTLTPSSDTGSVFAGWNGDADCSDGMVTLNSDVTCTATFNLLQFILTTYVAPSGSGFVSPDCSSGCTYDFGTLIVLTATENSGYFFNSWTNCTFPSNNVCIETIDRDIGITANFDTCLPPARIAETSIYYATLQEAYADADSGQTIESREVVSAGNLNANRSISVTIKGGFNCDYTASTGINVIDSLWDITIGTVTTGVPGN